MDEACADELQNSASAHLVHVHGYTHETELNKALQTSHLAINLRYPTMGEASGSQLRIWYHALPSLVTDVGWYSSLSRDTVVHVRPEHEIADIQSHLQAFLKTPEPFANMGQRGLRTLRRTTQSGELCAHHFGSGGQRSRV